MDGVKNKLLNTAFLGGYGVLSKCYSIRFATISELKHIIEVNKFEMG